MWRDDEAKNIHYIIDKPWDTRVENMPEDNPNIETHAWFAVND
jgi:hypothetical protein